MSDRRLHSYFRGQNPDIRWSNYLRQPHLLQRVEETIPKTPTPPAAPRTPTPQTYSTSPLQRRSFQKPEEPEWHGSFLGEPSGANIEPPVQQEQLDEDGWQTIDIKIGNVIETHRFRKFEPEYTADFDEDLALLRSDGYVIDPKVGLGSGTFGVVYGGYYGYEVQDFNTVDPALRFAVKVIDFTKVRSPFFRESFENEKYIMTKIDHKNCVKIQYIAHLGEQKLLHFQRYPEAIYQSPDRAYLFMEYANGGNLETWLDNNNRWMPSTRIRFIRDLFSGMRYLHRQKILHGDVHAGNILLFKEGDQLTAKWTDFGLSKIASEEQFTARDPVITEQYFYDNCRSELIKMIDIFEKILENRMKRMETPEENYQLNEYQRMVDGLTQPFSTIEELYDQFRNVLDED